MIDFVLFDFGGVLSQEGWKKGLRIIAERNHLQAETFIQIAADTIYETGYITGTGSEDDFWRVLKRKTGIQDDNSSMAAELMSCFILDDRMMALVKKLKMKKLGVGILSDQTDWLDRLNDRFCFFALFDHVFNSYHVGKGKRDASVFDDIADLLKVLPHRILFVDDDSGNVARAGQKGWNAIQYTDFESFCVEARKYLPDGCLDD
jgi:putative hydrolase of the HAD superfamily